MAKGIVAKFLNIKAGSSGRSASTQIGSCVTYITNSEKCDAKRGASEPGQIERELIYVTNEVKTLQGLYVGCRNITDVNNAVNEMMQVKDFYGKQGDRVALHGMISLDAEESDLKNAGKLILLLNDLLAEVFPEQQAVYAVHTNTDNLHIHFVLNTVGLDGRKIHMDKDFMSKRFDPALNKYARKYGFTPNAEWEKERKPDLVPFVERKIQLRKIVDLAIEECSDFNEFLQILKESKVRANVGKHLSLQLPDMSRRMLSYQLGSAYTLDGIKERIASKKDAFIMQQAKVVARDVEQREMVYYTPMTMKKYKEMTKDEQKQAVHLLRLGRNPWKEGYEQNWQIKRISKELTQTMHVHDLIRSYAGGVSDIPEAKRNIKNAQKELAQNKKAIKDNLKKHQAVIKLYEEMKQYEIKAYLYEFADCKEYESQYEQYKELTNRLQEKYDKTIAEVAEFVENQTSELLYVTEQSKELSSQYRTILKYERCELARANGIQLYSFFDAVGHSEAKVRANRYGSMATRLAYITSEDNAEVRIRVLTVPTTVNVELTVGTTVTVLDSVGNSLEEFSSDEMSHKEFNQKINETRQKYKMNQCQIFEADQSASRHQREQKAKSH